ncbi:MAG: hypothetical protein AAGA58_10340 [Verrucomicrobiota bacterium]
MVITYLLPIVLISILALIQIPSFRPAVIMGFLLALLFLGFKTEAPSNNQPSKTSFIEFLLSSSTGK